MLSCDLPMILAKILEKQSVELSSEGLVIEAAAARAEARQLKLLSLIND